jgi:hypothetical protein
MARRPRPRDHNQPENQRDHQNRETKLTLSVLCNALIEGLTPLADPTFTLDGKVYPKDAVLAPLHAYVVAVEATSASRAAWSKAVQDEHDAATAARAMIALLKPYLKVRLGKSNPALQSEYGIAPARKAEKTVAVKSTAIAKAKATRIARHNMGPKKRKGVTGATAAATPETPPATSKPPAA